jgi:hypothetical protein
MLNRPCILVYSDKTETACLIYVAVPLKSNIKESTPITNCTEQSVFLVQLRASQRVRKFLLFMNPGYSSSSSQGQSTYSYSEIHEFNPHPALKHIISYLNLAQETIDICNLEGGRSQWSRSVRHEPSPPSRTLESWV